MFEYKRGKNMKEFVLKWWQLINVGFVSLEFGSILFIGGINGAIMWSALILLHIIGLGMAIVEFKDSN